MAWLAPMDPFAQFLRDLFEVGQVALPVGKGNEPDFTSSAAIHILQARDESVRLSLAGTAPRMKMEAALEGAVWMYQSCQLFIERSRDVEALADAVERGVERWAPEPENVYALDLALAFQSDLHQHARQHAEADPLMQVLDALAIAWPLSSVGIPGVEIAWERISPWWDAGSLRQLYVDRIIARDDAGRLQHGEVAVQARACLGAHAGTLAGESVLHALCY